MTENIRPMALPDTFIDRTTQDTMYHRAARSAADIEASALEAPGVAQVGGRRA